MHFFWEPAVRPLLELVNARSILEIGSGHGHHTVRLAAWARERSARLYIVDPDASVDPATVHDPESGVSFDQRPSLEALSDGGVVDVALVDGDHNYFTVRAELEMMLANAAAAAMLPPIFVCHDAAWPYGRRDMYYAPDRVPPEHRHRWARLGVIPGQSELADSGGMNAHLANACHEGGPRNGVLTAIEDVAGGANGELTVTILPVVHGLALVVSRTRLEHHPDLGPWLSHWSSADGWAKLAGLADAELAACRAGVSSDGEPAASTTLPHEQAAPSSHRA